MAGISTSIQIADRVTPVLQAITSSMNLMVNSFSAADVASSNAIDPSAFQTAQQEIINASAALQQYQEEIERVRNTPLPSPTPPEPMPVQTWKNTARPQVFMNSGADRFEAELYSANNMAQQLYQSQRAISQQARQMQVTPPGMLNDVVNIENRMQMLANRIQEINSIPIDLRTERTNNELETLRGNLDQALNIQNELTAAISRMDINAANAAYRRLNTIVDSTEQNIRNNLTAQEQFNNAIRNSQASASGLESTIKRYAALLVSAATAGKAVSIADEVTQTTARLELMNYGLDTTAKMQQKIYQSAQRSRGAYQTTADVVAKLGMQARGAFSSNDELIAFTEQLNKTFVIAGASAQGVDSVMLQLTQSMASGKLQGEELNAVLDNAQPIVQNIADYMDVPVGKIKQLAADGAISAEIIKNAMFAAADETNAKFEQMPLTFSQVATSIQNQALMAFQPALQQLSAVTQTEGFNALVDNITNGIQTMASLAVQALNLMGQAALWVQENWSWLGPTIGGVTAAIMAYNIATGIQALLTGASTLAIIIQTLATEGLTAALLSCPLVWIAIAIGAVIAAIIAWIHHVGGLKVAWLICVNKVLTVAETLKLGFVLLWGHLQNGIDNMVYGFASFKVGVLNALGDVKVKGLMILQNFINGAIDYINKLIEVANSIGVISIDTIQHVEFGTAAALEEEAKQGQREADLAALEESNATAKAERDAKFRNMYKEAKESEAKRLEGIEAAKQESQEKNAKEKAEENNYIPDAVPIGEIAGNTGKTAGNTAAMADSMDILDEDLKYLRDAAEQEIINRFTLAELKVDVNNNNTLTTQTDFEDVNRQLADVTGEILNIAAEGGHI